MAFHSSEEVCDISRTDAASYCYAVSRQSSVREAQARGKKEIPLKNIPETYSQTLSINRRNIKSTQDIAYLIVCAELEISTSTFCRILQPAVRLSKRIKAEKKGDPKRVDKFVNLRRDA